MNCIKYKEVFLVFYFTIQQIIGEECHCGLRKPQTSSRIVGGKEVNPKYRLLSGNIETKSVEQILIEKVQAPQWSCGTTLINKRYVITAAHCLVHQGVSLDPGTQNLRVVVGEHNTCDGLTNEGGQVKN